MNRLHSNRERLSSGHETETASFEQKIKTELQFAKQRQTQLHREGIVTLNQLAAQMEITVDEPTQAACAEVERRASGLFAQLANAISSKLDAWRAVKKQEREEAHFQDELAVLLAADPAKALARYAHTPHDDSPSWWVLDDKIAETLRASFHTLPLAEASNVYARLGNQTRIRWDLKRQIK